VLSVFLARHSFPVSFGSHLHGLSFVYRGGLPSDCCPLSSSWTPPIGRLSRTPFCQLIDDAPLFPFRARISRLLLQGPLLFPCSPELSKTAIVLLGNPTLDCPRPECFSSVFMFPSRLRRYTFCSLFSLSTVDTLQHYCLPQANCPLRSLRPVVLSCCGNAAFSCPVLCKWKNDCSPGVSALAGDVPAGPVPTAYLPRSILSNWFIFLPRLGRSGGSWKMIFLASWHKEWLPSF